MLVDTNIILDIITDDPNWGEWSARALNAAPHGELRVNPVIFSELCVGAEDVNEVLEILNELGMTVHDFSFDALFLAAKAFKCYRLKAGRKTSPLPDFYIGAQAMDQDWVILTRDAKTYRTYFPTVRLIAPEQT